MSMTVNESWLSSDFGKRVCLYSCICLCACVCVQARLRQVYLLDNLRAHFQNHPMWLTSNVRSVHFRPAIEICSQIKTGSFETMYNYYCSSPNRQGTGLSLLEGKNWGMVELEASIRTLPNMQTLLASSPYWPKKISLLIIKMNKTNPQKSFPWESHDVQRFLLLLQSAVFNPC